jgi:hypothetical protein
MRPAPPARPRHTGPTRSALQPTSLRLASLLLLAVSVGSLTTITGCAASVAPVPAVHPASPDAPAGRLAGAPPSLRPGVVRYTDSSGASGPPPASDAAPTPGHHHTPDAPATAPTSPSVPGHHHAP